MGIHYDYKSTRGAKKLQKQHQRDQRRRKKKKGSAGKATNPIPDDVVITLDMLTDPKRLLTQDCSITTASTRTRISRSRTSVHDPRTPY